MSTTRIGRSVRLLLLMSVVGHEAAAQSRDFSERLERLVAAGNTPGARTLVDSMLAAAPEGSDVFVEALFWHAVLDSTAAEAERDYLRVVVEYPLSSRASAALLRLAELELARQARDRGRRHLEKLLVDYPQSDQIARAQYLTARLALDDGQVDRACSLLTAARTSVNTNDVELRNQILYLHATCARPRPVPADSAVPPDTVVRRDPRVASERGRYAIQVAAYNTRREATALSRQLQQRGLSARVVGNESPFRVRVGRFATREDARRAMTQAGLRGIIVEVEPQ